MTAKCLDWLWNGVALACVSIVATFAAGLVYGAVYCALEALAK